MDVCSNCICSVEFTGKKGDSISLGKGNSNVGAMQQCKIKHLSPHQIKMFSAKNWPQSSQSVKA